MHTIETISEKKAFRKIVPKYGHFIISTAALFWTLLYGPFYAEATCNAEIFIQDPDRFLQETGSNADVTQTPIADIFNTDILITGFVKASSLDITPLGTLFITDQEADQLSITNLKGLATGILRRETTEGGVQGTNPLFTTLFGNTGSGTSQFRSPSQVDASNGFKIYIADTGNERIQIFDRNLQSISVLDQSMEWQSSFTPLKIHVRAGGEIYAYDARRHTLHQFEPNGQLLRTLNLRSEPVKQVYSITSTRQTLYIFDRIEQLLHRYNPDGIYQGFLKLDAGTLAVRVHENELYSLHSNGVTNLTTDWQILSLPGRDHHEEKAYHFVDFDLYDGHVYLLSEHNLIRLPYEE